MIAHAAPPPPAAAVRRVLIEDSGVVPPALLVNAGTPVTWRNAGRARHTVTADGGAFGSSILLPGDTFTIRAPARPGVYAYHCVFHLYIRGTVTVSPVRVDALRPVDAGRAVTVRGVVSGVGRGSPVGLQRREAGSWVTVAGGTTGARGAFAVRTPALEASAVVRVLAAGAQSPAVRVAVRPVIGLRLSGRRLTVRLRPAAPPATVVLERRASAGGAWRRVARRTASAGLVRFSLPAPGRYRVVVAAHAGLVARASRTIALIAG